MGVIEVLTKEIKGLDTKSLFAIAGACMVEINTRILEDKIHFQEIKR